jgi:valyl-tRNA synthetase
LITAPFAPFLSESVYQVMRPLNSSWFQLESIHFHQIPMTDVWKSKGTSACLLRTFDYFSELVELTRTARAQRTNTDGKLISSVKL